MTRTPDHDLRFDTPLYTLAEAARFVGVPATTFSNWAKGYVRRSPDRKPVVGAPMLSVVGGAGAQLSVPFVALAEGMVLAAIRRSGVPMQRIRPALLALQDSIGVEHALASQRLYSDGAEVLYDFARTNADSPAASSARELVVLRSGQRVFADVVADYLQRIEYAPDGYAELLHLPGYRRQQVVVDPRRSFGQPIFTSGGAKVEDVLDRFQAGESLPDLAEDFGVPLDELEDAVRVASRRAA